MEVMCKRVQLQAREQRECRPLDSDFLTCRRPRKLLFTGIMAPTWGSERLTPVHPVALPTDGDVDG